MTASERQPSRDELLAMAFVDGELDTEAREAFERRLATEEPLLREVAQLKKLEVLARQVAPPEPIDFEWQRLEKELVHSSGLTLGLWMTALGLLALSGWSAVRLLASELGPVPKLGLAALLMGSLTAFGVILRARLRTLPYDPYTEVKR